MGSLKIPPIRSIRKAGYMEHIYTNVNKLIKPGPPEQSLYAKRKPISAT